VTSVALHAPVDDDLGAITSVVDAQDVGWWGEPDGDIDDVRHELERVRRATGSLDAGARVATVDGVVVGVAMVVGHGQTSVAVDPTVEDASAIRTALFEWLAGFDDTQIEAPAQDVERLDELAALGFVPRRSSFELERSGDVGDLAMALWPEGIVPVPFRLGVDDEELHQMIYSFWTEVDGHTQRPLDEWRNLILAGPWFDADLVVTARSDGGDGPIVGCALGRTYTGDVGWISQLGVARAARGCGLGRAVLVEGLHRLARKHPRVIGLGVEAENSSALGLYRGVGMEISREWVHCERTRSIDRLH
jgi:ribosomal protein S18 acetylase RimI-like enzyme